MVQKKNVQALEDGRDFDPNELEELITLVEDIMGWDLMGGGYVWKLIILGVPWSHGVPF